MFLLIKETVTLCVYWQYFLQYIIVFSILLIIIIVVLVFTTWKVFMPSNYHFFLFIDSILNNFFMFSSTIFHSRHLIHLQLWSFWIHPDMLSALCEEWIPLNIFFQMVARLSQHHLLNNSYYLFFLWVWLRAKHSQLSSCLNGF